MANYGLIVSDGGDNSFTLLALNRGTTSTTFTGGTDLLTNTFTVNATTGLLSTASGFKTSTTDAGDGLGHKLRGIAEAFIRAGEICQNDRSFNL